MSGMPRPSDAAEAGHYNEDVVEGAVPVKGNESTEVWLDFSVSAFSDATAVMIVLSVPTPGTRSVVSPRELTDPHTGAAGPRLACLPVSW
jgi:superoxide dismutase, Cu-Zn family